MPPWTASLEPLDAQLRSGQLGLDEAVRDTPSLPVPPPEHELIAALQDRGGRVVPVLLLACCLRNHNRPLLYWHTRECVAVRGLRPGRGAHE